jgi:Zn-dependent protease with chaperone function
MPLSPAPTSSMPAAPIANGPAMQLAHPPTTGAAPVDPRQYITPGTTSRAVMAVLGLILIILLTAAITWGIAVIFWIIGGIAYLLRTNKARAALRGSALRVGPDQFPEIHAAAELMSRRLGLRETPEIYVMSESQPNALATKIGQRQYVVLYDEIIQGARSAANPKVLEFVLAHELAHHALGHTGLIRGAMSANYRALSRRDEFSCDAVAGALINDSASAREALTLLMVGPHVFRHVNPAGLERQLHDVLADTHSRKAESALRMTHPLMIRRMARLQQQIKL